MHNDHDPTVSVIIPTYNRASLLAEAIWSVLRQSVPAHEIIVVDDGSTDETADVVRRFEGLTSKLILVALDHTPLVGRVRNAGVMSSSGSVLAFLDSDDIWRPDRIERQLAAWQQNPSAQFAFCNLRSFDTEGPVPGGIYLPASMDYSGDVLPELIMEPVIVPSTLMMKREAFDAVGPFSDGVIVEDYSLLLDAAAQYRVSYVPEPLVLMRQHDGARARSRVELAHLEYLRIVDDFVRTHKRISRRAQRNARHGMANAHLKLARLYSDAGRNSEARKHLRAMYRLRPLDRRLPSAIKAVMLHR